MKNKILVEVCCNSINDCIIAKECGADRFELVSAGFLGGLTPTIGTLKSIKDKTNIPIMTIVRPRSGGCCYSQEEFEVMCYDAKLLCEYGADGIVFGFLTADGKLDYERCGRFLEYTKCKQTVFHRAIDVIQNYNDALEKLISLGVTRVLTSGCNKNAEYGMDIIRNMNEQYGSKIEILACGSLDKSNILKVVNYTCVNQIHLGATSTQIDTSTHGNKLVSFGSTAVNAADEYISTDKNKLLDVLKIIK